MRRSEIEDVRLRCHTRGVKALLSLFEADESVHPVDLVVDALGHALYLQHRLQPRPCVGVLGGREHDLRVPEERHLDVRPLDSEGVVELLGGFGFGSTAQPILHPARPLLVRLHLDGSFKESRLLQRCSHDPRRRTSAAIRLEDHAQQPVERTVVDVGEHGWEGMRVRRKEGTRTEGRTEIAGEQSAHR